MGTLLSANLLKLMNLGGLMIDEPDALRLRDEQFPVVDNIVFRSIARYQMME